MSTPQTQNPLIATGARRYALLACGCCNVVLGLIGAVVPGMPTTVFLIIALWAFSRSSPRLRRWLYEHPRTVRLCANGTGTGLFRCAPNALPPR